MIKVTIPFLYCRNNSCLGFREIIIASEIHGLRSLANDISFSLIGQQLLEIKVVTEIICIRTDILIYLYMTVYITFYFKLTVNITFYFKFKSSYVLSRMISKFYTDSFLRTVNWYNDKYWVVISYI